MSDKDKNGNDGQRGKNGGKSWQERKLEKVNRDDFDVISRKTRDQSDFIGMLNTLDNLLYQLRMNMGRSSSIQLDKAQDFLVRSQKIKDEINLLNAEMCEMMGWDYRPPRGFTNPLDETGGKGKVKKGAAVKLTVPNEKPESATSTA